MNRAVIVNNLKHLKSLIGARNLSETEANGYVLLRTACQFGWVEIAEYLLSMRCYVNNKSSLRKLTETPLHYAVSCGSIKIVEMLLKKGAWVDVLNGLHQTPLDCAVLQNREKIVELLLVNRSPLQINNCFHFAVNRFNPNLKIIRMLVNHGASINSIIFETGDQTGRLPIQLAASRGNLELFMFLLAKGANINAKGRSGETLLHISAQNGHLSIVEYLVKYGASVNSVTFPSYEILKYCYYSFRTCPTGMKSSDNSKLGFTPLHLAAFNNNYDVVKFLLDHGANVDDSEKNGKTALHIAVEEGHDSVVEVLLAYHPDVGNPGNKDVLVDAVILNGDESKIGDYLLDYGFSIDSKYWKNEKLLMHIVEKRQSKILKDLIRCGADVRTVAETFFLLHSAVKNNYEDICEILLTTKVDVNLRDSTGNAPLHYAIQNKEICELLLKYGANVNLKDKRNKTPIVYLIENGFYEITKLFLDNGATIKEGIIESFNIAIEKEFFKTVELILERDKNFNVNAVDNSGRNPLHCAVLTCEDHLLYATSNRITYFMRMTEKDVYDDNDDNRNIIAKLLLIRGAAVNSVMKVPSIKGKGFTLLFAAAKNNFKNVVKTLLEYNADVNGFSYNNYTALHVASYNGYVDIVDLLLKSGADVDLKCSDGLTALHHACVKGHVKIVDMLAQTLLSYHCKNLTIDNSLLDFVNSKERNGLTPLMIASTEGFKNVVEILLNFGADVNEKDYDGNTAIHLAAERWQYEVINVLLKFGGDVNCTTTKGLSPISFARRHFHLYQFVNKSVYTILLNHVKKLIAADLYVSDENYSWAVNEPFRKGYFPLNDCHDELNNMKKYLIVSNISYHDLLTKSTIQLAVYAKNPFFVQSFNSCDYEKMFPLYSDIIYSRFRMGIKRNYLLEDCQKYLCSVNSDLSTLPLLCVETILSYLSDDQLKSVIKACKPSHHNSAIYKFQCI